MSDYIYQSASELSSLIATGEVSPVTVIESYLNRINERNEKTNAFIEVLNKQALKRAHEAADAVEAGEQLGPLHGVPVAIKDLSPMAGVRTTFGSKAFANHVAKTDAIFVERFKSAGAIPIGKTNACEFGHKGTTDNELIGSTSTPFDVEYNAGGSSGGSAAAVAEGLTPIAQGGDGGGSIRIPAACCGVYGFNPSFGRVPHMNRPDAFNEHTPFVRRGPLTRTVEDAALAMEVLNGPDARDPFSLPNDGVDFLGAPDQSIAGLSIAYSPDLGIFPLQEDVRSEIDATVRGFKSSGANIVRIDPDFDYPLQELFKAWKTVWQQMYVGISEGLREEGTDLCGEHQEDLSPSFSSVLENESGLSISDLKQANRVRTSVRDTIQDVLASHDLLVTSTLSRSPIKNTTDTVGPKIVEGKFVGSPIGWCLTYPFNLVENPAASIPAGLDEKGLPVGMQIIGQRFDDETVLAASAAIEQESPWGDLHLN